MIRRASEQPSDLERGHLPFNIEFAQYVGYAFLISYSDVSFKFRFHWFLQ